MSRFIITLRASRDLEEICDYFLEKSVDAGDRFVEAFNQKCRHLVHFPYLGRSYAQFSPSLRGISLMGYIIFYRIIEDGIEIVRIISGYRNLEEVFKT
ncbi:MULTISPECIES: type II toxin-antitoxin system RelE/ParE family toxin [Spirulina sp. CCY15215]|uniref:type II toxin-antitoxin system RelE/ParE family toxin n=1 Tax=Spirulina sp. CCY15215 TaxID=2767591 RepID=UPI00194FA57A|nr:type II toxin-antitoxin system RelE/ParE family toxin [Spirulina major]